PSSASNHNSGKRGVVHKVLASKPPFVFGVYRRQMKTIGYLGQIDKLFGAPATTRNWNTILSILRILKAGQQRATTDDRLRVPIFCSSYRIGLKSWTLRLAKG